MRLGFVALLLAACGAEIVEQPRVDPKQDPDPQPDPDPDPPPDPDPMPRCSNGRVVYLNFDGVTLRSTQMNSNAANNAASWSPGTRTLPAYHAASATRAADIADITNRVTAALAEFPVTVVTERPTSGHYVMVVLGGSAVTDLQFDAEYAGMADLDCGDEAIDDVAWVSDLCPTTAYAANVALGSIGLGLGLSGTTEPADCMCGWGTQCAISQSTTCQFSTMVAAQSACDSSTSQSETAVIHKAFCEAL